MTRNPASSRAVDVVVIGAGHSGLAMSAALAARSVDHVVLERGVVANAWHTERWDSLRLLTPNWMTHLPGQPYAGNDPDGFMSAAEVAGFIEGYAARNGAPVHTGTTVLRVAPAAGGYRVHTDGGDWWCRAVVLASGAHGLPAVPRITAEVPAAIHQLTPNNYHNPADLDDGGVLVVGASATGVQLADEIQRSGRQVTLAVGEHVRMPRTYRGRDIQWWMQVAGLLDQRIEDVDDPERARRVPSPQLVGTAERRTLDLNALMDAGVEVVGRFAGIRDGSALFSGSLRNVCAMADLKLNRLLDAIDTWEHASPDRLRVPPAERFAPTRIGSAPRLRLPLRGAVKTIVWATGFRPDYSWLDVPVLDARGRLRHNGGVAEAPGLYVLGMPYLRRRKSSFIHGATDDVAELSQHLFDHLDQGATGRSYRLPTRSLREQRTYGLEAAVINA